MTNLTSLTLAGNQLTGTIPTEIGNLVKLIHLDFFANQLSGTIPTEIGNLVNLTYLDFFDNQLSGTIPKQISSLINLESLWLGANQFTALVDLSALTNLSYASISSNQLDFGDLETSNISWNSYSNQANILTDRNENSGNVTLSVSVDGTNNTYKWLKNDIEINGETTNTLTVSNTADGVYYCEITDTNFPALILNSTAEGIGSSSLTQGVETAEYNALVAIYDATAGNNWTNNTNWKSSEPVNSWNGVTVTGSHVTGLRLYSNNLVGTIPTKIENLLNLTDLSLSKNQLTGSIPTVITNLTNLTYLSLSNNQFTGSIPTEIGSLTNLKNLSLSGNQLMETVPTQITSLTSLVWLHLEDNQLTGTITEIASLINLKYLYLSNNQFTGTIPSEISNLTSLEYFSVADNQLTGIIPTSIGSLLNLTNLYLENNLFTSLPDLSALTNLSRLYIQENKFDFGDLEKANVNWASLSSWAKSYSPQVKIGDEQNLGLEIGETKVLSVAVDGTNNTYQWYKNDVEITGATATDYTISSFAEATDAGVYVCKINDTNYPDLTLESNTITVSKATAAAIENVVNANFNMYPNPTKDILKLDFSFVKPEMLKVLDLTGKLLISKTINADNETINLSNFDNGIYILQLKFADKIISTKVVKN